MKQRPGEAMLTGLLSKASFLRPAQVWHHPQWAGPTASISNQENDAQASPPADLMVATFQLTFLFPGIKLATIVLGIAISFGKEPNTANLQRQKQTRGDLRQSQRN